MPFPYFGRKKQLAPKYPSPQYPTIIEPFAGAAGYSIALDHWERQVILYEINPQVVGLWRYLIDPNTEPDTILQLPDVEQGESLDKFGERGTPARLLVESPGASKDPRYRTASGWIARDWPKVRNRVASDLYKIKHWQIIEGDYREAPDIEATWFVDPPYQAMAESYASAPYVTQPIEYPELGDWCMNRSGQVIVCEQMGADWLPFEPLRELKTISNRKTVEGVWVGGLR